jgi:DNA (cytosine-5)-methyltransferase 1
LEIEGLRESTKDAVETREEALDMIERQKVGGGGEEMTLNHFSLFTGIGGIDIAASWAGFTAVGMCEIDDYRRKVLDKHWPDVPKWRDIFELTGEEILDKCGRIDLLSGGFPCQPFSAAGKRKGQADERYLWPEMFRIIREVKPQWVLGENVRGILSIDAGRTFGRILADLAESGYRVGWLCYGAGDVFAPHKRERVFIVAYSQKQGLERANAEGITCSTGCASECGQRGRQADRRTAQPGLGGVLNGFPCGMDGNKWPAGPGEQYSWEPPRIDTGVKDRVARIKALGNAVVPAQVYPILKAISEIERGIQK